MKNKILPFILLLLVSNTLFAQREIAGIKVPQRLTYIKDSNLDLFGVGVRKFLWMDMYVGAVFLSDEKAKPKEIIQANENMGMRLHILSSLVSNKRIIKAIEDGFQKSTNGNLTEYQSRIDRMISFFDGEIAPGDVIDMVYTKNGVTQVFLNEKKLGEIKGLDFKKALFGVWLSNDPIDKSLKQQMLGS
jgi:hypothetical protein